MTIDDIFKQLGELEAELNKYGLGYGSHSEKLMRRQKKERDEAERRWKAEQVAEEDHVRKLYGKKQDLLSAIDRISDGEDPLVAVLATKGVS